MRFGDPWRCEGSTPSQNSRARASVPQGKPTHRRTTEVRESAEGSPGQGGPHGHMEEVTRSRAHEGLGGGTDAEPWRLRTLLMRTHTTFSKPNPSFRPLEERSVSRPRPEGAGAEGGSREEGGAGREGSEPGRDPQRRRGRSLSLAVYDADGAAARGVSRAGRTDAPVHPQVRRDDQGGARPGRRERRRAR